MTGSADSDVPDGVQELAQEVTAGEGTQLGRARAIERYLNKHGYFSNADAASSRPGHRADRISRMLSLQQMIGDDEQYSVLMALMLHSLGIRRVVTGCTASCVGRPGGADRRRCSRLRRSFTGGLGHVRPHPAARPGAADRCAQAALGARRCCRPEPPEQPVELPPACPTGRSTSISTTPWPCRGC